MYEKENKGRGKNFIGNDLDHLNNLDELKVIITVRR